MGPLRRSRQEFGRAKMKIINVSELAAAQERKPGRPDTKKSAGLEKEYERAKAAALRLLGLRARSRAELQRKLVEKGYSAGLIRRLLAELTRLGLINDVEFARAWVEHRLQSRPAGARALLWELRRRGVDDKIAAAAVQRAVDEAEELRLATELAQARLKRSLGAQPKAAPAGREEFARIGRFLAGRGFAYSVILEVINKLQGEETEL